MNANALEEPSACTRHWEHWQGEGALGSGLVWAADAEIFSLIWHQPKSRCLQRLDALLSHVLSCRHPCIDKDQVGLEAGLAVTQELHIYLLLHLLVAFKNESRTYWCDSVHNPIFYCAVTSK